jgi:hypothetical protein
MFAGVGFEYHSHLACGPNAGCVALLEPVSLSPYRALVCGEWGRGDVLLCWLLTRLRCA